VRELALTLLRELDPREPVRLLGVRVAGLDDDEARTVPVAAPGQLALALDAQ